VAGRYHNHHKTNTSGWDLERVSRSGSKEMLDILAAAM
jgi:hypothetical protein